jgi:hypothetical protein
MQVETSKLSFVRGRVFPTFFRILSTFASAACSQSHASLPIPNAISDLKRTRAAPGGNRQDFHKKIRRQTQKQA